MSMNLVNNDNEGVAIFDLNKDGKKRRQAIVNKTDVIVIDDLLILLFNDGNQYITSSNNLSLRWTRAPKKTKLRVSEYNYDGNNSSYYAAGGGGT